jgi:hypothetical protein
LRGGAILRAAHAAGEARLGLQTTGSHRRTVGRGGPRRCAIASCRLGWSWAGGIGLPGS